MTITAPDNITIVENNHTTPALQGVTQPIDVDHIPLEETNAGAHADGIEESMGEEPESNTFVGHHVDLVDGLIAETPDKPCTHVEDGLQAHCSTVHIIMAIDVVGIAAIIVLRTNQSLKDDFDGHHVERMSSALQIEVGMHHTNTFVGQSLVLLIDMLKNSVVPIAQHIALGVVGEHLSPMETIDDETHNALGGTHLMGHHSHIVDVDGHAHAHHQGSMLQHHIDEVTMQETHGMQ